KAGPLNTITFVGKPSYGKGYDLFRSLSRNKVFQEFRFVTIGGDNKLPYLETLQKIKEAAAVVVPSRWPEPFGRVALEALMLGTPVVATSSGGLTEIIKDRLTGISVKPTPAGLSWGLKEIIERNSEFRRNIRLYNPKLKEKFINKPVQKYLKLYQSLLS
ncbi:MAG TPA: glycosyltransferase, partial [Patescibacteria group bacterium]|nr:glycosyltransferase [Patescibacteria group bacterium]